MADALTTITKIINSPPGQLAAGGVMAGMVWKFFERVEAVLTENTKLEIAVWLLGVKVGQKVEPWPDTFARVFDRVFGTKHLSWKCYWRSCIATYVTTGAGFLLTVMLWRTTSTGPYVAHLVSEIGIIRCLLLALVLNVWVTGTDYMSLLKARNILTFIGKRTSGTLWLAAVLLDAALAACFASLCAYVVLVGLSIPLNYTHDPIFRQAVELLHKDVTYPISWISDMFHILSAESLFALGFPSFFTSIWIWLYAGSGFLLKAARRFDIGFDWFNRKFDIEKKPLQSIGLVAGALVAVAYWVAVIVSRVVG